MTVESYDQVEHKFFSLIPFIVTFVLFFTDKGDPTAGTGEPEHERLLSGGPGFGLHPSWIPKH